MTLHIKSWPRLVGVPPPEAAPKFIDIALINEDEDKDEDNIAEEERLSFKVDQVILQEKKMFITINK